MAGLGVPSLGRWQLLEKGKLTKPPVALFSVSFVSGRSGVLFCSLPQPWASPPLPSVTGSSCCDGFILMAERVSAGLMREEVKCGMATINKCF